MATLNNLIERLKLRQQLTCWDLMKLAENVGYKYVSQSGSHRKYQHSDGSHIVITTNAKHQNSVTKALRKCYMEYVSMTEDVVSQYNKIPEFCMHENWRITIRQIRTHFNKTLQDVADFIGINMHTYRACETKNRFLTQYEFNKFCECFNIDSAELSTIPVREQLPPPEPTPVRNEEEKAEDIAAAVELKLARFKQLHEMLRDYDSLKKEYDILYKQLRPLLKEL